MNITVPYSRLDKLTGAMRYRYSIFSKFCREDRLDGHEIREVETWRSGERQRWLWESGRNREGQIVTNTLSSKHMFGEAVDIVFFNLAQKKITYEGPWERIGFIAEKCGLIWGGRWPSVDRPHVEYDHNWQKDHWGTEAEKRLIKSGLIKYKKNLDDPISRAEVYEILNRMTSSR